MASSSTFASNRLLGIQVSEKLTKQNYGVWTAQVLATIRGARLEGFITGKKLPPAAEVDEKQGEQVVKVPNPIYEDWVATDQQVLGFLLSTLSKDVLPQVASARTAAQAWKAIQDLFASQTRARTINIRLALTTTKKEGSTVTQYFNKMRSLGEEMAAAGKPIEDEEMISYIINGLDSEFNPVVSALVTRVEPIPLTELLSQLLSFESRLELQQGGSGSSSSANSAGRSNRGGMTRGGFGRGRYNNNSRGGGRGLGRGGRGQQQQQQRPSNSSPQQRRVLPSTDASGRPICQVCYKIGHIAPDCWHRFDENYVPEERHVAAAMSACAGDASWYMDTGATDSVTSNLEKLHVRDKYTGNDQIHTASGAGSRHEEDHS